MMSWAMGLVVFAAVLAIFATTTAGRRIVAKLGLRGAGAGSAPDEDVEFLMQRCHGDPAEVARRIAAERERFPALGEADHYRRAIRRLLAESAESAESAQSNESAESRGARSPGTR